MEYPISMRLKVDYTPFLLMASFLFCAFSVLTDFGATLDSQKNFQEGKANLDFLFTGRIDPETLMWQMHGAFSFMAADLSRRLFHLRLNLLDPVSARFLVIPLFSALLFHPLYRFVKSAWGSGAGLAACCLLITYPAYFGHAFNNLKDVPLLVFFSLTIFCFSEWRFSGRISRLYAAFVFLGLAVSIKVYALLASAILLLWTLSTPGKGEGRFSARLLPHIFAGLSITAVLVLLFYAPGFWGIAKKAEFISFWKHRVGWIAFGGREGWNIDPLIQILYRTPLPFLFFALLGAARAMSSWRKEPINPLLLIWVTVPVLLPCLPGVLVYRNGLRLFLVFLVPFSILAVLGLRTFSHFLSRLLAVRETWIYAAFFSSVLCFSLPGLVSTHPYQTTYFNSLAGGLGGAQEKGVEGAWDYWLGSYREAGRWLDSNACKNARIFTVYYSGTHPRFNTDLLRYAVTRTDLKIVHVPVIPLLAGRPFTPKNAYLVVVPFDYARQGLAALKASTEYEPVYRIRRQGGEVCTIYRRR